MTSKVFFNLWGLNQISLRLLRYEIRRAAAKGIDPSPIILMTYFERKCRIDNDTYTLPSVDRMGFFMLEY